MSTEYRKQDEDGRVALSSREYSAIRAIWGAVNALNLYHGELERRCKSYKNGWRDLRCLVKLSEKVMHQTLSTVPRKKLLQMRKELDNTICEIKTRGISGCKDDGFMYVSEDTIINLCKAATDINCFGCEKTHSEARKSCQLYKDIQSIFNYDFDECKSCPLAGGVVE